MEDRLMNLEVKLAFLENHVAELDTLLAKYIERVRILEHELAELRESRSKNIVRGTLEEERPPHHEKL